jgi:hypothetical protein
MPSATARIHYSSTGGKPNARSSVTVQVSSKNPTESEVSEAIKKKNPKWNFIILEIK